MKNTFLLVSMALIFGCSQPTSTESTTSSTSGKDTLAVDNTDTAKSETNTSTKAVIDQEQNTQSGIPRLYEEIKTANDLPSWLEIKYKGEIKFGAKWTDKAGENVLLINITEATAPGTNDEKSMELYAMQYTYKDKKKELIWTINDFVKACPFDIDLFYVPYSFSLTDLNGDGVRETLFMYQLMCRSDVSEDDLKLTMHDGKTKYAIRGTTKVNTGNSEFVGGKMEIDASFEKAPKGFKDHAVRMWDRFVDVDKREK